MKNITRFEQNGCKSTTSYAMCFHTQSHKPVLTPDIQNRFKEIVMDMQESSHFEIKSIKINKHSVQIKLVVCASVGANTILSKIKHSTASILCKEFPEIRKKISGLWTREKLILSYGKLDKESLKEFMKGKY